MPLFLTCGNNALSLLPALRKPLGLFAEDQSQGLLICLYRLILFAGGKIDFAQFEKSPGRLWVKADGSKKKLLRSVKLTQ